MAEIFINEPCKVGWRNMKPSGNGRFCDSCSLVVVDFSKMSNQQILNYLAEKNGKQVCGNCRTDQVETPKRKWPRWLASVITFVLGVSMISSCYTRGKVSAYASKKELRQQKKTEERAKKN